MPSPKRFSKVRKQLEQAGWMLDHVRGEHHIFVKPNFPVLLSIPVHRNQVKPHYVKKIEKLIQEYGD